MLKFAIKRKTLELFHEAVDNKDYLRTKLLIENCDKQKFVVDSLDANGLTPLQRSCFLGNVRLVRLLIDAGANLSIKDREGWTVLHAASVAGNFAVVKYLIKIGVDLEATTDRGELALDLADKDDVVLILVKGMIRKGLYTFVREYFKRNPKTFQRIIEDMKKRDKLPKSRARRMLPRRPRSLDLSKLRRETAKLARVEQSKLTVPSREERGEDDAKREVEPARGTFRRSFRRTPAPQRNQSVDDFSDDDELDDRRASVPLSPSWISSSMSSLSSISSNSSVPSSSVQDWPDVIYASHKTTRRNTMHDSRFSHGGEGSTAKRVKFGVPNGLCDVANGTVVQVNKLVESGKIDVHNLNEMGVAPLHEASFANNVPVMELLIHKGADINKQSLDGSTPLHAAVQGGASHAMALLIECGADLFVENENGALPIEETEDEAFISLLQEAMTVT